MGSRVHKVPIIAGIRQTQPAHDTGRVQADLLDGVDTQAVGTHHRRHFPAANNILHCAEESDQTDGVEAHRHLWADWLSRISWVVDGQEWAKG